jgi:integrase/recombinase XerC
MQEAFERFLSHIKVNNFSEGTIAIYRVDLDRFYEFVKGELGKNVKLSDFDDLEIRAFLKQLADSGNSPITRARKLAAIKSFYNYLCRVEHFPKNHAHNIEMPKVDKNRHRAFSYLAEEEYRKLLKTVSREATTYFFERDIAIVSTLLGTGIRVSELVNLNIDDIDFEHKEMRVLRKGQKTTVEVVNDGVLLNIRRWLRKRDSLNLNGEKAIFISKQKRRMDKSSVQYMVKQYGKKSGIGKRITCHTLRHSFGTNALKKGNDIETIRELMGHESILTTQKYMHSTREDKRKAANSMDVLV